MGMTVEFSVLDKKLIENRFFPLRPKTTILEFQFFMLGAANAFYIHSLMNSVNRMSTAKKDSKMTEIKI